MSPNNGSTLENSTEVTPRSMLNRAVLAGTIGNFIEWYDFAVYAYLASIVATEFFPSTSTGTGLLLAFATFGVGFVIRPIGSIVIGRIGDKYGRRQALMLTVVGMAITTFLIGVTPSYSSIGIWAPIILVILRLAQGFSAGGEWGGAAAYLVEYASPRRRGFIGSWQQFTILVAFLVGSLVGLLVSTLPHDVLYSWGWRIPFLVGIIAVPVGWYLRHSVPDTPKYQQLKSENKTEQAPLTRMTKSYGRQFFQAVGFTIIWTVAYYIFLAYLPTYLKNQVGISETAALGITTLELVATAILTPFMGALSDRVGRKPMLITSCVLFIVLPYPLFMIVGSSYLVMVLVVLVLALSIAIYSGPGPAAIAEIFPTSVRYTSLSIPYNIATAIFGGFAPFIATLLINLTGNSLSPIYYVMAAAIISLITIISLRETAHEELQ